MTSIAAGIKSRLPEEAQRLLKDAGEIAARRGEKAYLVGGVVRDLLLGRLNLDLDLVVEGDAPLLARQLAQERGGRVVTHPHFGTATFRQNALSLDLVTARSETYARPGALPTVKPGNIKDDLFRRDFTINAIAASLDPAAFGQVIDPYGGQKDLERSLIRILHGKSFIDDPTRVWRAIRYEQRLGFRIETRTEELLRRDVAVMGEVSGDRIRHELDLVLKEDVPEKSLLRAGDLGALHQVDPALKADAWLAERFEKARLANPKGTPGTLYLALLAWRLDDSAIDRFVTRLNFGKEEARALKSISAIKNTMPQLAAAEITPSSIYRLLESRPPETIMAAALAADSMPVRERLELYLISLRFVRPSLNGEDLKKLGVPAGKRLGLLLRRLLESRLDRVALTREEEEEMVREWLRRDKNVGG